MLDRLRVIVSPQPQPRIITQPTPVKLNFSGAVNNANLGSPIPFGNLDGGTHDTEYGGLSVIDGGDVNGN